MDIRKAFAILGLPETASPQHVRAAYRDLVKVWHPDRFVHDPRLQTKAAEQLRQINNAYQWLQDRPTSTATAATTTAAAPPAAAAPPVAMRVPRFGGQRKLLLAIGVVTGVTMILSIVGAPSWSYLPPDLPDLLDPASVTLDASRSAGGGLDRTYVEEPVASDSGSPSAPAMSWYASTALGLANSVEGSWLLNGKRFTFHQGMIRAAGDRTALGYYDPSTPQTLHYRKASNVHHVVVEVVFTQLTMRWYVRDSGRRLGYEFVRAG